MRKVTATEAARGFADLLDEVERTGESVVIERRGRAIAAIGPPPARDGNGWKLLEVLREQPADEAWLEELRDLRRQAGPPQERWSE